MNHSFFASQRRAETTFPFSFRNKEEILKHLIRIEELRNRLCYGRDKEAKEAHEAIELLFALRKILEEEQ
jgi:hypothetical protein